NVRAVNLTATHVAKVGGRPNSVVVEAVGESQARGEPAAVVSAGTILSVAVGSRRPLLALGSSDASITFFDYVRHREIGRIPPLGGIPLALSLSADDQTLCATNPSKVRIWNIADLERPRLSAEFESGEPVLSPRG